MYVTPRENHKAMSKLFNSNTCVLALTIVVLIVLMALPFTAGAQEQESDTARSEFEEWLALNFYKWDCFDFADFQKKAVLVQLIGFKVPEDEYGYGQVTLGGRKGSEHTSYFNIEGLDYVWRFGPNDSRFKYAFSIQINGDGHYFDFSNTNEGESVTSSQAFRCVDRSDEAGDGITDIIDNLYTKGVEELTNP